MTVYTVFGQSGTGTLQSDTASYTLGMQFSLSQNAALTAIWFYSAPSSADLPSAVCIYQITGTNTGSQVTGTVNTSPSWSGAAGSGWVKVTYPGTTTLNSGTNYRVCVNHTAASNWYSVTANYWSSGAGGSGITSGIITAPNSSSADGSNQDAFITPSGGGLAYPNSSFNASNYWIDVEVTSVSSAALVVAPPLLIPPGLRSPLAFPNRPVQGQVPPPPVPPAIIPFTAPSDAIPGFARPGFTTPGDPLTPGPPPPPPVPPAPAAPPGLQAPMAFGFPARLPVPPPAAVLPPGTSQGVLSVAGAGTVTTAAAILAPNAPGTLTGAGAVAAPSRQQAPVTVAGAGAVTNAAVQGAGLTLAGAGAVANADAIGSGGSIIGAGTISAPVTLLAPLTIAGAGGMTTAAVQFATLTIAGAGSVTAAIGQGAGITGAGSIVVLGSQRAAVSPAGAGLLTASAAVQGAILLLTGTGQVTGTASLRAVLAIAGAGTVTAAAVVQLPFTLGALTASDEPASMLTASDQRTGGPS